MKDSIVANPSRSAGTVRKADCDELKRGAEAIYFAKNRGSGASQLLVVVAQGLWKNRTLPYIPTQFDITGPTSSVR